MNTQYAYQSQDSSAIPDQIQRFDPLPVAGHISMLRHLAQRSGVAGNLTISKFEPANTQRHFRADDLGGMHYAVMSFKDDPAANVYAMLSLVATSVPDGRKGSEAEVVAVLGAVCDQDAGEQAKLPLPPDYILETSPGNFQYFYLYDRALPPAEAKPLVEALTHYAGTDPSAKGLDHVFRIAGTLNRPSERKIKKYNRSPEPFLVRVVKPWDGSLTSVDALRAALASHWPKPAGAEPCAGVDEPPSGSPVPELKLSEATQALLDETPAEGARSERIMAAAGALRRYGPTFEQFLEILGASKVVQTKYAGKRKARALESELKRLWGKTTENAPKSAAHIPHASNDNTAGSSRSGRPHGEDPDDKTIDADITRLNKKHAVLPIGGKTRVVTFGETDDFPGRQTITMVQTIDDFVALYNKYHHTWINEKGEEKRMPLGTHWRYSRWRRQYDGGMSFMPKSMEPVVGDKLNLWQGYGVKPAKPAGKSGAEGCDRFLYFAYMVICSGDAAHYDYLIKREATILQKRVRSEIALGLRSEEEGVGKGFYERVMSRLLGTHALQITNPAHVVGKFNPHLETLLRLTADEALFVGNHEHRNALFSLITEPKLTIEPKGCGVYTAPNYLNISLTSNSAHFIPVSGTARTFFVPTVSAAHMQDFNYFRDIEAQLDDGGYEALLWHLLHEVDLKDFDVRKVPRTAGLIEQAAQSRKGVDGLVELICNTGMLPGATTSKGFSQLGGETGFHKFIDAPQRDSTIKGRALLVTRRLKDDWGCTTGDAARVSSGGQQRRGISWPTLAELRARFEKKFGEQTWMNPALTEWTTDPLL